MGSLGKETTLLVPNTKSIIMIFRVVSVFVVFSLAAGLDLKAICPAYPHCDNNLIAAALRAEAAQSAPAGAPQPRVLSSPELPCANFPFCDVNHVALEQGLPCANFPNCDLNHVALAQRAGRRRRSLP